jgi:DNA-binding beta-propeller fold protein YncE
MNKPAMKLGTGAYTYELVDGWAKVPSHITLGYTHGVVTDAKDNVYIFNQSEHAMVVFDKDGNFLTSWGKEFAKGAHGLYLAKEGAEEFLYLVDYEIPVVVKTTLDGKELLRLKSPPLPDVYKGEAVYKPTDVCIAPNGDIYVTDGYGQSYIHHYDKTGKYIRSWGGKGTEPGQMQCPHGIRVDTRGKEPVIYVADRANIRIQVFALDGKFIKFINDESLRYPCTFHFGKDGTLYIPDLFGTVIIWDKNDKFQAEVGANPEISKGAWPTLAGYPNVPKEKRIPGTFISPHGLWTDSKKDMYVVEWIQDSRITKLKRLG